jgi:hypothetical protein
MKIFIFYLPFSHEAKNFAGGESLKFCVVFEAVVGLPRAKGFRVDRTSINLLLPRQFCGFTTCEKGCVGGETCNFVTFCDPFVTL